MYACPCVYCQVEIGMGIGIEIELEIGNRESEIMNLARFSSHVGAAQRSSARTKPKTKVKFNVSLGD